jgi:hypothetical protein
VGEGVPVIALQAQAAVVIDAQGAAVTWANVEKAGVQREFSDGVKSFVSCSVTESSK